MRARRVTDTPIHPLIAAASLKAPNEWWKKFLTSLAFGTLPKGITINGPILSYSKMGETIHYELSLEPEPCCKEIITILCRHLSLSFAGDATTKAKSTISIKTDTWKAIKRKYLREALCTRYIQELRERLELTPKQVSDIQYHLHLADIYGILNEAIQMQDGRIYAITCIFFDGENFSLSSSPPPPTPIRLPLPADPRLAKYPSKVLDPIKMCETHYTKLCRRLNNTTIRVAALS